MFSSLRGYSKLSSQREPDEALSEEQSEAYDGSQGRKAFRKHSKAVLMSGWICSAVLMVLLCLQFWRSHELSDLKCLQRTSAYSPILNDIPTTLTEIRMNGTFTFPSIYRGEPSPEIDAAWDRVSMLRPLDIHLTDAEFLKIGRSVETAARNAPENGGGFFLQPEFSHQLHCVNLLRKVSHFKFGYYKPRDPDFTDNVELFKTHIDHCTEMLRQFIMCHADVGIVTAHWIDQRRAAWPDFNTNKVCRDFDAILEWAQDHQLPPGTPLRPSKPLGASALPAPP
ncbi:hypothetical protein N7510_005383 [Penicillium lagena]|uniref:uncharacterized protein n=1 Tax=Penicillium lagena TaxID=94218 RepID=UPI0025404CD6|nr:uncharacterized protein N7510_005383 [Penicillium lagena]KAJ5612189.1 hypothetical protein N7510_005383 [Penicillium lagena]